MLKKILLLLALSCCVTRPDLRAQTPPALQPQVEIEKRTGLLSKYGISLIPEPQVVSVTEREFRVNAETALYVDPQLTDDSPVSSLQEGVASITGWRLGTIASRRPGNVIILSTVPESRLTGLPATANRREAYLLDVTDATVLIRAASPQGLFYGVQTFLQLLEQGGGRARGMSVVDWPDMDFRGIHIDLWYHQDRPWYYEYCLRQLSHYKINAVVFEFEDKLFYTHHPVLSAPGAMPPAEMRRLVALAKRYYIDIVPLVQTLGHVNFIAKHAEFARLREVAMSNWQLCPLKQGTFDLIRDVLDDVMDAVQPAKYFHIGGDEARELGMGPECQQKWGDKAAVESYKLWLNFICNYLKQHGKTAIVWDDMFLRHFQPGDLAKLPDNLIYVRWSYGTGTFPERQKQLLKLNYPVWIATAAQTMTPIFPDQNLRVFNNSNFIPDAVRLGIRGVVNTAWEDPGTHPETYWMGFLCSAEYAWSSGVPATAEFRDKFFTLFYGRNQRRLSSAYDTLSEKGFLRGESAWTPAFQSLTLPSLPDTQFRVASSWPERHGKLVEQAKTMQPRYREAVEIIQDNLAREVKNRYSLEVLLISAKTLLHFTDVILAIHGINEKLLAAQADHQKGDDPAAMSRYNQIARIIEDLRYEKSALYAETQAVWEKSMFPKDFRHIPGGREKYVHQIDRDFYYGNKTMDLDYIFEVEEKLGLFAYQQGLYEVMVKILRAERPW